MSFWPFGQNLQSSNVNKILEEYIQILHNDNEDNNVNNDINDIYDKTQLDKSENSSTSVSDILSDSFHIMRSDSKMISHSNSSININNGTINYLKNTPNSINDEFLSKQIALRKKLDKSFIDRLLQEGDLLNELMRQNNSLLDFICLGYFYNYDNDNEENDDERKTINTTLSNADNIENKKYKKIYHLEYLIDLLMESVDKIDICDINVVPETDQSSFSSEGEIESNDVIEEDRRSNDSDNELENLDNNGITLSFDSSSSSLNVSSNNPTFNEYFNKANLISDIFSMDIWILTEALVKNHTYLKKIWSILNNKNCNNERSPLVLIFLKITQNLLATRQDQFLNFIRSLPSFVDDMLKHVEITSLMDFFLKCISTDKLEAPTGLIEFVHDQQLIDKCVDFFDNEKYQPDTQVCVYEFLKALIAISANAPLDDMSIGPNSLTRKLASTKVIKRFIYIIINQRGHALNNIVSIVIELIRKNNSDYDQINLLDTTIQDNPPSSRDPIYLGYLLKHFALNLPKLFAIVQELTENKQKLFKNQIDQDFAPLGFESFRIAELIAELLHCSNMALMNSRKVEKIARKRDSFRDQLFNQLQDALQDLDLSDNSNYDDAKRGTEEVIDNKQSVDENFQSGIDSASESEIDESFEIPYINQNQNDKLRTSSTIGDLFKISIYDTKVLTTFLKLFLEHPWNNFWHNIIFDIIQQIFNGRMDFSYNSFLVYSLLNLDESTQFSPDLITSKYNKFSITDDFLLKGYKLSYDFYEKYNMNLGYMGHLVLIAEEVVKFSKLYKVELISPDIYTTLQSNTWQFYSREILDNTRIMYSKILGGGNYVDDGNGNIIPQIPETSPATDAFSTNEKTTDTESDSSDDSNKNSIHTAGGGLINVEALDDNMRYFTESDLHDKLRELWIETSNGNGT